MPYMANERRSGEPMFGADEGVRASGTKALLDHETGPSSSLSRVYARDLIDLARANGVVEEMLQLADDLASKLTRAL
jgi:hypothetical protein